MASHEYFEANDTAENLPWSYQRRRGFDDAYEQNGYRPPRYGPEETLARESADYRLGFCNAAFAVLEDAYPKFGAQAALALSHGMGLTQDQLTDQHVLDWLLLDAAAKHAADPGGHLLGLGLDDRTAYG